jgi:methyl-accepting chemotaxis protein
MQWTLRRKLLALTAVGLSGTLIVALVGAVGLKSGRQSARALVATTSLQRLQMDADMMHDAVRADVLAAILGAKENHRGDVIDAQTSLGEHAARIRGDLRILRDSSSGAVAEAVAVVGPDLEAYLTTASDVVAQAAFGTPDSTLFGAFLTRFEVLEGAMEQMGDRIGHAASDTESSMNTSFARLAWLMAIVSLGIPIIVLLIEARMAGRITRTVQDVATRVDSLERDAIRPLGTAMEALARGDVDAQVQVTLRTAAVSGDDEIAAMARNVNSIIEHTQATVSAYQKARSAIAEIVSTSTGLAAAARDGDLKHRGNASQFQGVYAEMISTINGTLDAVVKPVEHATETLERIASKDLTARVDAEYHGDHRRVQDAVNATADALADALAQVRAATEQVSLAAEQIAAGSQSLANAASEQAAGLEEISAGVYESSATAGTIAEETKVARGAAEIARQASVDGHVAMERLAVAVKEIETSSMASAKIVKTIDEIAFQTNLLALNAAVEAARAGDAGRGFAVVAEEVRALALRAAEAARQTGEMIESSVQKVTVGSAITAEAVQRFDAIGRQVMQLDSTVAQIASASSEQAIGIQGLTQGLDRLNQTTQSAAAHAEESAAAAEELSSQSEVTRAMVATFRLPGEAHAESAAPTSRGGLLSAPLGAKTQWRGPKTRTHAE